MVVFRGMVRHILAILLSFAAPLFASADSVTEVENKAYVLCKNRKQVRSIRVAINNSGICSTFYSKEGDEKVVGSGKNHESCVNFLNNIKTNLEKSNWTCRDISSARTTAGLE